VFDPRSLRTYLMVCRHSSISAAARKLNISQPAVSVTIAQLEDALGSKLFERSRSGITLTPAGAVLMRRAESMEALLRDAADEVALAKEGIGGPLRIGGTPGALVSLIPDAVNRMAASNEQFALHVIERPDEVLIDLLRKGQIEIAVVTTGISALPADIEERSLARDPFDLIVGKLNSKLPTKLSLAATHDLLWVLPEAEGAFRRQVDAMFISAGIQTPRNAIRCDSLLTTKAIVRDGRYVTILPRRVAAAELSLGILRAIRLKEATINRDVGIRTLKGHRLSEWAQRLVEALLPVRA